VYFRDDTAAPHTLHMSICIEYIWSLGGVYVESMYSMWTPYEYFMEYTWSLCGVMWRPSGVNME